MNFSAAERLIDYYLVFANFLTGWSVLYFTVSRCYANFAFDLTPTVQAIQQSGRKL